LDVRLCALAGPTRAVTMSELRVVRLILCAPAAWPRALGGLSA
jgi:hypothetical protein